jgi:GT2 family glycosyltransferase
MLDLSIIIVNYNAKQDLLRCLRSLEAVSGELALEVIVVDNGSSDGSCDVAEVQHPHFRFLRVGKNIGFAAGCNRGLVEAKGRQVMLLNPDTEVLSGALSNLVSALNANPRWGIVGPLMVDGKDVPYPAARRFPTPRYLFCECTRLAFLFPRTRMFAGYFYGDRNLSGLDRVDQVEGSALMISEAARAKVGPLDERFFLFFEEVDWCKRAADAGFECHLVPTATVRHHRSTTMSRNYLAARQANAESAMRYFAKHHGAKGLASLRRWMKAALMLRQMGMSLAAVLGKGDLARLRAEGARGEREVYSRGLDT